MTRRAPNEYGAPMHARADVTPLSASPRVLSWIAAMAEALTVPLLLVRADGVLLNANMAGMRELARGALLVSRQGQVAAARETDAAAFEACMLRAVTQRTRCEWRAPGLAEPVIVAPVSQAAAALPMLMLMIVLPAEAPLAEACRLFAYQFGLSPGELEVLIALCRGLMPRDIAAERGVSLSTVRTQLARVRRKCGEHRLGTLVPRVASPPAVDAPDVAPGE